VDTKCEVRTFESTTARAMICCARTKIHWIRLLCLEIDQRSTFVKHVSERLKEAKTNCIVRKSELWMDGERPRSPRKHPGK